MTVPLIGESKEIKQKWRGTNTAKKKVSLFGVILVCIFPHSDRILFVIFYCYGQSLIFGGRLATGL